MTPEDSQEAIGEDAVLKTDSVREGLGRKAQACLDHVRAIVWGEGTSVYYITDHNGIVLSISIAVKSIHREEAAPASAESLVPTDTEEFQSPSMWGRLLQRKPPSK